MTNTPASQPGQVGCGVIAIFLLAAGFLLTVGGIGALALFGLLPK